MPGYDFFCRSREAGLQHVHAGLSALQYDFAGHRVQPFPGVFPRAIDRCRAGQHANRRQNEFARDGPGSDRISSARQSRGRFGISRKSGAGCLEGRPAGMVGHAAGGFASHETGDGRNSHHLWRRGKARLSAPATSRPALVVDHHCSIARGGDFANLGQTASPLDRMQAGTSGQSIHLGVWLSHRAHLARTLVNSSLETSAAAPFQAATNVERKRR